MPRKGSVCSGYCAAGFFCRTENQKRQRLSGMLYGSPFCGTENQKRQCLSGILYGRLFFQTVNHKRQCLSGMLHGRSFCQMEKQKRAASVLDAARQAVLPDGTFRSLSMVVFTSFRSEFYTTSLMTSSCFRVRMTRPYEKGDLPDETYAFYRNIQ